MHKNYIRKASIMTLVALLGMIIPTTVVGQTNSNNRLTRQEREALKKQTPQWKAEYKRQNAKNMRKLKQPERIVPIVDDRSHRQAPVEVERAAAQIDLTIYKKLRSEEKTFNPLTTDNQFVRRIYLDIAGRIPTEEEVRDFVDDRASDKRAKLIDELLLRPDYRMQMFNWLTDMLRVRETPQLKGNSAGYQAWLMRQLATNQSWDKIVHELLVAEGNMVTNPATGWLLRDRGMPLDSVSNTLTTFLGADIACAQCHDHPKVDWTQRDFLELAAFFGSTYVPDRDVRKIGPPERPGRNVVAPSVAMVENRADKQLVFPDDYAYSDAKPGEVVEPHFPVFQHLLREGSYDDPAIRRSAFAYWISNKRNGQFAAAISNRIWKKLFGRAIIEPVTAVDTFDEAVNEDLLIQLRLLFFNLDYDLMAFQRVLYNTRAFQSQGSLTPPEGVDYQFPGPLIRRLTAEQAWDSLATLYAGPKVNEYTRPRLEEMATFDVFAPETFNRLDRDNRDWHMELFEAAEERSMKIKRASPRQIRNFPADPYARASEHRLPASDSHFLRMFGQSNREISGDGSREGGIPQVLMLLNGDISDVFENRNSYFFKKLRSLNEDEKLDSLYHSFLSRAPTEEEKQILSQSGKSVPAIAWILMNTREFMFTL